MAAGRSRSAQENRGRLDCRATTSGAKATSVVTDYSCHSKVASVISAERPSRNGPQAREICTAAGSARSRARSEATEPSNRLISAPVLRKANGSDANDLPAAIMAPGMSYSSRVERRSYSRHADSILLTLWYSRFGRRRITVVGTERQSFETNLCPSVASCNSFLVGHPRSIVGVVFPRRSRLFSIQRGLRRAVDVNEGFFIHQS
jgi:hypothetical protein